MDLREHLRHAVVMAIVKGQWTWHPKDAIDLSVLIVVEACARVADEQQAPHVAQEIRKLARLPADPEQVV